MPQDSFLPIAVWYTGGRARATMVRPPEPDSPVTWRQDLQNIRDCGFNSVRCWVDWATGEPRPGEYHFETLDLLMDLAEEVGLKVILQLYLDSAPDWLVKYFPDCRYIAADGTPVDSQGAPGYCYDHPGVKIAAENFMKALAARVKDRPGFLAWDLWSEPHIVQWGYFDFLPQPAVFCYCQHTVQRFRDWLRQRYGSLEEVNKAWYRQFSSWDVIPAPKFISLMTYTEYIDWIEFIMEKLAEDLRWRHDTVRVEDHHLTTSHSAVPGVLTLPLDEQGSPDDWKMPHSVDVWGTSLYPKHVGAKETNFPFFRAAMLSSTRSACDSVGAPYWLGELQAGHGYVGMFASHMTAQDARMYIWQPLAHGAKGLCFYAWHPMSSGYESAGFGMANLDGTPSDRALAAGEIARAVDKNLELFVNGKVTKAEAAVCLDVNANVMWQCMREPWHYIPSRSYVGAYKALYEEHLPADYIHPEQLASGKLADYKLLYLPFALMLPRDSAAGVEAFVRQGGVAIAEARTAWNDEKGYCGEAVPGFGLERVFGCRERGAQGVDNDTPVPLRVIKNHQALPLLKAGDVLTGARFKEALEILDPNAEVVAEFEDGLPAIVVNRYGAGWGVFVGTMLSLGYYRFQDENAGKLLKGLPRLAGIQPPVGVEGIAPDCDVEVRLLEGRLSSGAEFRVFFAFNHTETPQTPGFHLTIPGSEYTIKEVITDADVPFIREESGLLLRKSLAPGEIWVLKVLIK